MDALAAVFEVPLGYKAKSSPEKWNAAYETILRITTAERYLDSVILEDSMPGRRQRKLEEYGDLVRQLCISQLNVSVLAFQAMLSEDLAARWLGASLGVRKKHVLIGIAGACSISTSLNQARLSCAKELRVSYLSADGHVLLDLINALAPDDLSKVPANPQYINSDEWDKVRMARKGPQNEETLGYILLLRSELITFVLQFIICSFLGRELPQIAVHKKPHSHNKAPIPNPIALLHEQAVVAQFGKEKFEEKRAILKAAQKKQDAKKVNICRGCGKMASNRENFKRCGACWKIDREFLYCSGECQRAHWGQHKLMCGKTLDYETAVKLATGPSTSSDIPPPANDGFKPTIELRIQREYLKNHPAIDYVVMRSVYVNRERYALMTYRDPVRPIFRKHRDDAIKSGNRVSVALICDCVLWDIELHKAADFRREMVVDQFSREYKYPLVELERALEEMGKFRASIRNEFPSLARQYMKV